LFAIKITLDLHGVTKSDSIGKTWGAHGMRRKAADEQLLIWP
jgi:hypothetical protein